MTEIKHVAFPIKRNDTTPKVYDANGKYLFWISLSSESNALEELREKGERWLDFRNRTDPMREALADEEFKIADFIVTAVNAYDKQRALIETLSNALETISTMHGTNPSLAYADVPEADYIKHVLYEARQVARKALSDTKEIGQ